MANNEAIISKILQEINNVGDIDTLESINIILKQPKYIAYIDGSYKENPGRIGYGAVIIRNNK